MRHAWSLLPLLLLAGLGPAARAEDAPPQTAYLLRVRLPIVDDADTRIRRQLEAILERVNESQDRPRVVLELTAAEGQSPGGSQFERCLSLARYLTSDAMRRLRTVAYLPGEVSGHAVMVVMACEEIVVDTDAKLGPAAEADEFVDATMRQGYLEIATDRRTVKPPLALAMLERSRHVLRVEFLDGSEFLEQSELEQLQQTKTVTSVDTVARAGDLAQLSGRQLRRYGVARYEITDRRDLAAALEVQRIEESVARGEGWRGALLRLDGRLSGDDVKALIRSLQDTVRTGEANLVVVHIRSPGGAPEESADLANKLAELDPTRVRTLAFIDGEARADAWLPAFACDEILATEDAVLGGPGAPTIDGRKREALIAVAQRIATLKQRDWSFTAGLLDGDKQTYVYERGVGGATRVWTAGEHSLQEDRELWTRGQLVETREGARGAEAARWGLIQRLAADLTEALRPYELQPAELEGLSPPWTVSQIQRLAALPWLGRALLFFGFFALMSEISAPGLGVAGFVSAVCFMLFFWLQFLNGTAGYLELLLFLTGIACVLVEFFVLPGVGVFGFGGGLMVLISLILASQTFVIPSNSYQVSQLPGSVFTLVAALGGGMAAMALLRHYLPDAPVLKRLMLEAPAPEQADEPLAYLFGKRGVATTPLVPSGKVSFGDALVDVTSDGDMIDAGASVVVKEVRGSRIVVRAVS